MNGRGLAIFAGAFVAVLATLGTAYVVVQVYRPPASATAPVAPETRQFDLLLHVFEAGEAELRRWIPPVIVANEGDTVILRVINGDPDNAHGFGLAAFNLSVPSIPPGESVTLRFKAARAGVFHFGCMLAGCAPDHATMIGQLVVLQGR